MRTTRPIALAALLLASPLAAELPAPDHVLFGTATRDGLLVESGVVEVRLGTAPEPITTYPIGTVLAYGERFVLRLPMDVREPRRPGTARSGEEARIYLDGVLAGCTAVGDSGSAQEVDIDTSFDDNPELWIVDADPATVGGAPDARLVEGGPGSTQIVNLVVRLSRAVTYDVVVDWATANGTATGGGASPADYLLASGSVTIPEGEVEGFLALSVFGDDLAETDETFTVTLANPHTLGEPSPCDAASGVALRDGEAIATVVIEADDSRQAVRVADGRILEGDGGTPVFARLLITADLEVPNVVQALLSIDYETVDGTAAAGSDYAATTGTATIDTAVVCPEVGKPCAEVLVEIFPDNAEEGPETFFLDLLTPPDPGQAGYEILDARGVATIATDEAFLFYVEAELEGTDCIGCLRGPLGGALSPDGLHLYVAAGLDNTLSSFERDADTGRLAHLENQVDDEDGVDGLEGVQAAAVSPDGLHLYTAGFLEDQIAIFDRDGGTGLLTYSALADRGAAALNGPTALAVSPDGLHLYAAAKLGNALESFARDAGTGELAHFSTLVDSQALPGGGQLDGLLEPRALVLSPDGLHLYAASAVDSAVTMFSRNALSGELAYLGQVRDATGNPPIDGLNGATALAFSPDGLHLYVAGELDDAVAVFRRDPATGLLTWLHRRRDGLGGVTGLDRVTAVAVSRDGGYVFAASRDGNALTVFRRDTNPASPTFGRLLDFIEARVDGEPDPNGVGSPPDLPVIDGLAGGLGLVVSPEPDGRHIYVIGNTDDGLAVFLKDLVAPELPEFDSPTPSGHVPGVWSNDPDLEVGFRSADDPFGAGLAGYPVLFDQAPATALGTTLDQLHEPLTDPQIAAAVLLDGTQHHVHVRACDGADNCSATAHQGPFLIDTVDPALVTGLLSTSHTVSTPSNLEELTMVWTPATDAASGVAGYAYTVDGNSSGTCSQAQNLGAASTVTTAPLTTGTWYFHICTLDVAGNWSPAVVSAGPYLIDLIPPQVEELRSVPHTGDPQLHPGETTSSGITRLIPDFDEPMVGDIEVENYHLFSGGADGVVDSSGCGAATGDDAVVTLGPPEFLPVGDAPALSVGSPRSLPAGVYRMVVCSVPGLTDLAGNVVDGNGDGVGGDEFQLDFEVNATNRLLNPNFDIALAGWVSGTPGNLARDPEDSDLESSSGSGTFVANLAAPMTVGQCFTVAPGSLLVIGGVVRLDSLSATQPAIYAAAQFHSNAVCTAPLGSAQETLPVAGDGGGAWEPLAQRSVSAPPGAQSVLFGLVVEDNAAQNLQDVWFDTLYARGPAPFFDDGFETGDTQQWSLTVP
jgi:6-phosphogluconolactonase (cycloisomerase 2 family)